jgi:hypothetical protein
MIITVKKLQSLFLVSLFCSFAQVIPSSSTSPKPKGAKRAGCVATGTASPLAPINEVTLPGILASIHLQKDLTLEMAARYIHNKESRYCETVGLEALAYAPDTPENRLKKNEFFTNRSSIENRKQIDAIRAELHKRRRFFSLQEWPGI